LPLVLAERSQKDQCFEGSKMAELAHPASAILIFLGDQEFMRSVDLKVLKNKLSEYVRNRVEICEVS
jgi:hypothetical protein